MTKLFLIFLGPTGCGKTTQATKIAQHYRLEKITAGDIVRNRIASGEMKDKDIQNFNKGFLVYTDVISDLINDEIINHIDQGAVIDGYPRSKTQLSSLEAALTGAGYAITAVVYISVSKEISKERVLGRNRSDDSLEALVNRLDQFGIHTKPMLEEVRKQGKLIQVNGAMSSEQVTEEIINKLNKLIH